MRLTDGQVKVIKDKLSKITPGKWAWRLNPKAKDLMLISNASMMPIVLTFWRYGFQGAIAVFRDFDRDILEKADKWGVKREPHHNYNLDIKHPDAQFIADASADMRDLLDTIEALQHELDSLQKCYDVTNVDWKSMAQENQSLRQDITKLHGIDGVPYIGGLIVDAVIQYVKQLQHTNDIYRADLDDANVQMAYRDKVIGELKQENERFKNYKKDYEAAVEILAEKNTQNALYVEALKQVREALFAGQYWTKHYEHLASLEQIEEAIEQIDKVVGE